MNETYVTVSGNVVGDPVARLTKADVPFVTFRVASNVRRVNFKTGEYIDAGTNFVNVTAFRSLGVNLANSLKKGEPVIVYGRMRINQWDNGERSGTTVEIDAYNVGHDLTWGQSEFTKVAKPHSTRTTGWPIPRSRTRWTSWTAMPRWQMTSSRRLMRSRPRRASLTQPVGASSWPPPTPTSTRRWASAAARGMCSGGGRQIT